MSSSQGGGDSKLFARVSRFSLFFSFFPYPVLFLDFMIPPHYPYESPSASLLSCTPRPLSLVSKYSYSVSFPPPHTPAHPGTGRAPRVYHTSTTLRAAAAASRLAERVTRFPSFPSTRLFSFVCLPSSPRLCQKSPSTSTCTWPTSCSSALACEQPLPFVAQKTTRAPFPTMTYLRSQGRRHDVYVISPASGL